MKANFIVAGTQKGGTTAIARFLAQHSQVSFSTPKETHFFDDEELFSSPITPAYDTYHQHFDFSPAGRAVGEATPIYMYWKPALGRIKNYNPEMKWIFFLRNPIERAYSHYVMERNRGAEDMSFSDAIRAEEDRLAEVYPMQHRVYSYIDRGYYSRQIKLILNEFPMNQMLFLKTEDLREHHQGTLEKVFDFLSIDGITSIPEEIVSSNQYPRMCAGDENYLWQKFEKEIDDLEQLLTWDCSNWRVRSA